MGGTVAPGRPSGAETPVQFAIWVGGSSLRARWSRRLKDSSPDYSRPQVWTREARAGRSRRARSPGGYRLGLFATARSRNGRRRPAATIERSAAGHEPRPRSHWLGEAMERKSTRRRPQQQAIHARACRPRGCPSGTRGHTAWTPMRTLASATTVECDTDVERLVRSPDRG